MARSLKLTFLIHAVVALVLGALFLLIPGRFLKLVGWWPSDYLICRLVGAAMLALAWSSFRGWRAEDESRVAIVVELEAIFCVLACVGLLRYMVPFILPWSIYLLFAGFVVFAALWIYALVRMRLSR